VIGLVTPGYPRVGWECLETPYKTEGEAEKGPPSLFPAARREARLATGFIFLRNFGRIEFLYLEGRGARPAGGFSSA